MASQAGSFNIQEFSDLGTLLVGGRLYTYAFGTTTQKTAYTDAAGLVPQTYTSDGAGGQYIALNARGELPAPLYLASGSYDLALKTILGATVWTRRADAAASGTDLAASTGSALVGFLQAGTGAVIRDVQEKLREVAVSPQEFMSAAQKANVAARLGTVDVTAALQAAVDAVAALGGGTVSLPPGNYKLTSAITITNADTRIVGSGRGATILSPAVSTDCIVFNIASKGGWGVEHLSIKYSADGTSGSAISTVNGQSGEISNVYIERCYHGIKLGNSQNTRVQHVECWYFNKYAIYGAGGLNDVFLSDCFLNGAAYGTSTPGAASVGLYFDGKAQAVGATNVEVIQCFRPMQSEGSTGSDLDKLAFSVFTGCWFDSSSNDVRLNYARSNKFTGCWFSQRSNGLTLQNAVDTEFTACSFTNNDMNGCVLNAGTLYTRFNGCTFDSNGKAAAGTYDGLSVAAGVTDWQVVGGIMGNFGTFAGTQSRGINIAVGASDRYTVKDVTFAGNINGQIADGGSGSDVYMHGNFRYRTSNQGGATILSGASTVVVNHGLAVTPAASDIQLTRASGNAGSTDLYVTGITSTQFTINTAAAPLSNMGVSWMVRTRGA